MKRREFRYLDPMRVRWAEVDMQRIVFNGHYLMYFDTAVAGYWRAMGMPYHETMEVMQGDLYVRKATLEYQASARYDEMLHVGVRVQRVGNSSIVLTAACFRGEQALVTGELVYVFADPASMTSRPVPQALREWLDAFETGQPMVRVEVGTWGALRSQAQPLRHTVFVDEQGIDPALEQDGADDTAVHAIAFNRLGLALGTGRLVEMGGGSARIGRMAVLASMRGSGVGSALLDALVAAARSRGLDEVVLHAQTTALPFYSRQGFVPLGPPFEEAGLPHQTMVRILSGVV